jgi:hypothetical protein
MKFPVLLLERLVRLLLGIEVPKVVEHFVVPDTGAKLSFLGCHSRQPRGLAPIAAVIRRVLTVGRQSHIMSTTVQPIAVDVISRFSRLKRATNDSFENYPVKTNTFRTPPSRYKPIVLCIWSRSTVVWWYDMPRQLSKVRVYLINDCDVSAT